MAKRRMEEMSYQSLRQQLDDVVQKLQHPDCDVDQAVELYEQALRLTKQLETYLQTAENRLTKVKAEFGTETGE